MSGHRRPRGDVLRVRVAPNVIGVEGSFYIARSNDSRRSRTAETPASALTPTFVSLRLCVIPFPPSSVGARQPFGYGHAVPSGLAVRRRHDAGDNVQEEQVVHR